MLKSFLCILVLLFSCTTIYSSSASAKSCGNISCKTSTLKRNKTNHVSKHHSSTKKKSVRRHAVRHHAIRHKAKRNSPIAQGGSSANAAQKSQVVALIKNMAPHYGVPTWFALRIAKVESGYNPNARGSAGEIGVFQLKCATAKGLGFNGGCGGLYNANANVEFGLKHLSLAIKSSGGNLRLAASKHNGGLGRKSLVPKYVQMVF